MVCILIFFCCIFYFDFFDFFDFFRDVCGLDMFCCACLMIDRARAGLKIVGNDGAEGVFGRIESEIGAEPGASGMYIDILFGAGIFCILIFFMMYLDCIRFVVLV